MIYRIPHSGYILGAFLAAIAAVLLLPFDAIAQPDEGEPAGRRLQQLKRMKMIEALDLGEEQSIRLFARQKDFRKKEHELNEARRNAIEKLEEMVNSGASEEKLLAGIVDVKNASIAIAEGREQYFDSLSDILSVEQQAQLVVFEAHFAHEVRKLLEQWNKNRQQPGRRPRR